MSELLQILKEYRKSHVDNASNVEMMFFDGDAFLGYAIINSKWIFNNLNIGIFYAIMLELSCRADIDPQNPNIVLLESRYNSTDDYHIYDKYCDWFKTVDKFI